MMTGIEVGLLSVVVALGSIIGTSKVNGRSKLTKDDHEVMCGDRLKPVHDGIIRIETAVDKLLSR
jgi:hypothetical protein